MTTRADRIRQHLERHGYHLSQLTGTVNGHPVEMEPLLYGPDGALFAPTGDEPGWDNALAYFLQDASKTGARIQDLIDHGPGKEIGPVKIYGTGYSDSAEDEHWRGYCTYPSDNPTTTGDAKTVDASVADCWRRVFIDSEESP